MSSFKDIIDNLPESGKGENAEDVMLNPEYLRHSSTVISEALQQGFDVLQLDNGDIVTTGTKIVVTQYRWDAKKGKMRKLTAKERKEEEKKAKARKQSD